MAIEDRAENREAGGADAKKKPFEPPRLFIYGDIATVTQNVGKTGASDGAKGANNKSNP